MTTFTQGLILMALAGVGMGCLMPSTTKAVIVWFPARERATAMGVKQTAVNVGGIIAATTLPAVALALSWHYGFLGIGVIAIIIGIVSFILYKEPPSVSLNTADPATPPGTRPSMSEALRNRDIWPLIGASVCIAIVEFSAIAYFVLYLKESLLFSVVTAGFFLALMEAGGVFGKPITGLISDRLLHGGRQKLFILMCCLASAMCIVFAFLPQGSPSWLIIPLCLVFGFVGIGWGGLHMALVGEFAGRELAGRVTAFNVVFILIGIMAGPPVFGYIADITGSYQIGWQFLAVMAILAAAFLLFVKEERRKI